MTLPSKPLSHQRPSVLIALVLFVVPLILYCSQIGRWAIDCDEFYTYFDSSLTISKLLEWETKPIYYIICHFLMRMNFDLPLEVVLRLPSAVMSSFIPVTAYWLLWSPTRKRAAFLTAILFLINPWILGFAITARFYGVMTWLVLIAMASLLRWMETGRLGWLGCFVVSALIATGVHTTAAVLYPAGMLAVLACWLRQNPTQTWTFVKKWSPLAAVGILILGVITYRFMAAQIDFWLNSEAGAFGSYSVFQLLAAIVLNLGIPVCVLGTLPLWKAWRDWADDELMLIVLAIAGVLPFFALVFLDAGGVTPRYFVGGLTAVFVLAGKAWAELSTQLPRTSWRGCVALAIVAAYVPSFASNLADGGHYDYRSAALYVEAHCDEDAMLIATGHLILQHFLPPDTHVDELTDFASAVPRPRLETLIEAAQAERRQLIIVSRESRNTLSAADQAWLYARFALVRTFETKRYDHRTHRMAVYEYRPSTLLQATGLRATPLQATPQAARDGKRDASSSTPMTWHRLNATVEATQTSAHPISNRP